MADYGSDHFPITPTATPGGSNDPLKDPYDDPRDDPSVPILPIPTKFTDLITRPNIVFRVPSPSEEQQPNVMVQSKQV